MVQGGNNKAANLPPLTEPHPDGPGGFLSPLGKATAPGPGDSKASLAGVSTPGRQACPGATSWRSWPRSAPSQMCSGEWRPPNTFPAASPKAVRRPSVRAGGAVCLVLSSESFAYRLSAHAGDTHVTFHGNGAAPLPALSPTLGPEQSTEEATVKRGTRLGGSVG